METSYVAVRQIFSQQIDRTVIAATTPATDWGEMTKIHNSPSSIVARSAHDLQQQQQQ